MGKLRRFFAGGTRGERALAVNRHEDVVKPASAPAKSGGHGDHWGCVFQQVEQESVLNFIRETIVQDDYPEKLGAGDRIMVFRTPGERLSVRACVLVEQHKLASAYPEAQDGPSWPIVVREVVPWSNGLEGQISGECHSAMVSFFDTRFYANKHKYVVGQTYNFRMAAFAYTLGRAPDTEVETDMGAKLSLKGASAYMPANMSNDTADIDDYWFHSSLEAEPSEARLAGRRLLAYPITLALPDDYEMSVHLYAASHVTAPDMEGLEVGEDVEGFLWLQGCLSGGST